MNAIATIPAESHRLSPEEIKQNTRLSLARDLLARALHSSSGDLHITLLQVLDAGLLDAQPLLVAELRQRADDAEKLTDRAREQFPFVCHGPARHLKKRPGCDLAGEVDLYR